MSLLLVCTGGRGIASSVLTLLVYPYRLCFLLNAMSRPTFINSNVEYHDNSTEYNIDARGKDINTIMRACANNDTPHSTQPEPEDVTSIDTSFLGTDRFPADVCEKNLREAIDGASGKADACRRIMLADTCGYIHIRQYTDARKAELINPFAKPKYTFTDDDFCKARSRMNKK